MKKIPKETYSYKSHLELHALNYLSIALVDQLNLLAESTNLKVDEFTSNQKMRELKTILLIVPAVCCQKRTKALILFN